jgi:hypothetical protein
MKQMSAFLYSLPEYTRDFEKEFYFSWPFTKKTRKTHKKFQRSHPPEMQKSVAGRQL